MNFIDKFEPKGFVVIKDKDGKILRANYNTIVNEGKRTLIGKLFKNILEKSGQAAGSITKEDADYDFYGVFFDQNLGETTLGTDFNTVKESIIYNHTRYKTSNDITYTIFDFFENSRLWFEFNSDTKSTEDDGFYDTSAFAENKINEFNLYYDDDSQRYYMSITIRVVPEADVMTDQNEFVSSLGILLKRTETEVKDGKIVTKFVDSEKKYTDSKNKNEIYDYENDFRLFSRFRFDMIPLTSESEFILTYYIYF